MTRINDLAFDDSSHVVEEWELSLADAMAQTLKGNDVLVARAPGGMAVGPAFIQINALLLTAEGNDVVTGLFRIMRSSCWGTCPRPQGADQGELGEYRCSEQAVVHGSADARLEQPSSQSKRALWPVRPERRATAPVVSDGSAAGTDTT